jgi:hypothetical protein
MTGVPPLRRTQSRLPLNNFASSRAILPAVPTSDDWRQATLIAELTRTPEPECIEVSPQMPVDYLADEVNRAND